MGVWGPRAGARRGGAQGRSPGAICLQNVLKKTVPPPPPLLSLLSQLSPPPPQRRRKCPLCPHPRPTPPRGRGQACGQGRSGGEGAKREKSLPVRRGALPSPSTHSGKFKEPVRPAFHLAPSWPAVWMGLAGRTAPPHPPAATLAPNLAPCPLRAGGFRKVRGKTTARAPSPNTTPSPQMLRLRVRAGMKPARERQTAGKLFAETPAFRGGHPLPSLRHPLPALRAIRHCTSTVHSCVMMGGAQKRSCFKSLTQVWGRN